MGAERFFEMMKSLGWLVAIGYICEGFFDPSLKLVQLVLGLNSKGHRPGAVVSVLERDQRLVNFVIFELRKRSKVEVSGTRFGEIKVTNK